MLWWVYILECQGDSYFVDVTDDVERRFNEHKIGRGARHTRLHQALSVRYRESFKSFMIESKREKQLKHWSHTKKQSLNDGDVEMLKRLSQSKRRYL